MNIRLFAICSILLVVVYAISNTATAQKEIKYPYNEIAENLEKAEDYIFELFKNKLRRRI